jgi:cytochrome c oxidase assembly protein subunit 15
LKLQLPQNEKLAVTSPRWVHYLAIAAACATFPLIVLGGLVTSYDVGMAVPDAPTTFGHNMLLYPIDDWLQASFGVRLEHGHRVFGALVGLITLVLSAAVWAGSPPRWLPWIGGIVLASVFARGSFGPGGLLAVGGLTVLGALVMWPQDRANWRRWLALMALGLVLAQGGFGVLRVVMHARTVAVIHGCVAQAFFALMACLVLFTSRTWADRRRVEAIDGDKLLRLALTTTGFVYVQLVLGAILRHLGGQAVLIAHLGVAFVVLIHVALLAKRVFVDFPDQRRLVRMVELLGGLTLGQLMLGTGAWATSSGLDPDTASAATGTQVLFATAHVSVGALILATCVLFVVESLATVVPVPGATNTESKNGRSDKSSRTKTTSFRPSVSGLESRELWTAEAHV